MATALVILDQRSAPGAAHNRAPPARRAIIDIHRVRARAEAHPRSYKGFFVRLRAIALLQVTAAAIYVGVQ